MGGKAEKIWALMSVATHPSTSSFLSGPSFSKVSLQVCFQVSEELHRSLWGEWNRALLGFFASTIKTNVKAGLLFIMGFPARASGLRAPEAQIDQPDMPPQEL